MYVYILLCINIHAKHKIYMLVYKILCLVHVYVGRFSQEVNSCYYLKLFVLYSEHLFVLVIVMACT